MIYGGDKNGNLPSHYNRYTIHCLNDVDLPTVIEKLSTNINGLLQVYVAAYCSTTGSTLAINEETGEEMRIETCKITYPNAAGHVNTVTKITSPEALEKLKDECEFSNFTKSIAHQIGTDSVFSVSNVKFNRVLTYTININSFPPGWVLK